uniref:Sugar phosphate transporter domain-containing protein n=1 Tax=Timspurckia oligopyrenoides TaxID=708627 RepID=A0A7S1EPJ3_9RHOD|mmetsp:Transcript_10797/g.19529  ORF Transcript_10797/g.19529 Transcript_10797/m.19529 type:complete len:319 (+) Transcript_10797:37-993(+)
MAKLENIWSGVYYVSLSTLLTVVNKSLFAQYDFPNPTLLFYLQSITTLIIALCLYLSKVWNGLEEYDLDKAAFIKYIVPLNGAFLMMVWPGLASMQFTSLIMFNTLRKTSVVIVLILEWIVLKRKAPPGIIFSVGLLVFGVIIAATGDLAFDMKGYFLVALTNIGTSSYLILIKRTKEYSDITSFTLLIINTMITTPVVMLFVLFNNQFSVLNEWLKSASLNAVLVLSCSCILAVGINHAIYVNTSKNSPLTQAVCAQLKDVFLLVASYFVFDQKHITVKSTIGVFTSLTGSAMYAVIKLRTTSSKVAPSQPAKIHNP